MKEKNFRNKGGRPKKEEQVKGVFRTIRFSPAEDEQLTAKLSTFGGSRSDFIRKAALGAEIKSFPSSDTIKLLQEYRINLRNIGTNLDAIAHRANIEYREFDDSNLRETKRLCKEFAETIKIIQNEML